MSCTGLHAAQASNNPTAQESPPRLRSALLASAGRLGRRCRRRNHGVRGDAVLANVVLGTLLVVPPGSQFAGRGGSGSGASTSDAKVAASSAVVDVELTCAPSSDEPTSEDNGTDAAARDMGTTRRRARGCAGQSDGRRCPLAAESSISKKTESLLHMALAKTILGVGLNQLARVFGHIVFIIDDDVARRWLGLSDYPRLDLTTT